MVTPGTESAKIRATALVVVSAIAAASIGYAVSLTSSTQWMREPALGVRVDAGLIRPSTLVAEQDGSILVLDPQREQILRWRPGGALSVLAGTGERGSSGDGGPARDAKLALQSGLAAARDGTVYFSNVANCRIRAISPSGMIRTVVVGVCGGIAVSPAGRLFVTSESDVDEVTPQGRVRWIAGGNWEKAFRSGRDLSASGDTPSTVLMQPTVLAFDGAGNLDIASSWPRAIYRLTTNGEIEDLGFANANEIVMAPDGSVLASEFESLSRVTAQGISPFVQPTEPGVGTRSGQWVNLRLAGVAVTSSGLVYVDTDPGDGWALGSRGLFSVSRNGHTHVLATASYSPPGGG